MAPKASSKARDVKVEPSTPKPKVKPSVAETPKKSATPRPRKPPVVAAQPVFTALSAEGGEIPSITVKYEGSQQAAARPAGGYTMSLKLEAPNAFTAVKTVKSCSPRAHCRICG